MNTKPTAGLFFYGVLFSSCLLVLVVASDDGAPPEKPTVPTLNCQAFPGSAKWTECFANFQEQMGQFQQQMQSWAQSQAQNAGTSGSGSSSSIYSNGYQVQASGLSVTSNNINGQMYIEAYIGEPTKTEITKNSDSIRFDFISKDNEAQWLTVSPPPSVSIDSIKHEIKDQKLTIWNSSDR